MSVLITGGAGFVGLEVARQLLAQGETGVTVFSRNPSPLRLGDLADNVTAVAGDVGNYSHVLNVVKASRPRVIYHLGAMLSVPCDADPASAIQTNAMGTFYVLEAARLFEVEQVIFSSSVGTYGLGMDDGPIDDLTIHGLRAGPPIWRYEMNVSLPLPPLLFGAAPRARWGLPIVPATGLP